MKIGYQPFRNQCGGGVEQNDIAARASFASEDGPQDGGILCCVAALKRRKGRALKARIFRRKSPDVNCATFYFGNFRFPVERNFVQAVGAMHNEAMPHAKLGHDLREQGNQRRGVDAQDLRRGVRGIRQWAQHIEHSAYAEAAANWLHALHRRMHQRGKKKNKSSGAQAGDGLVWSQRSWDAERVQHIC